jgi:hypothetical protein
MLSVVMLSVVMVDVVAPSRTPEALFGQPIFCTLQSNLHQPIKFFEGDTDSQIEPPIFDKMASR